MWEGSPASGRLEAGLMDADPSTCPVFRPTLAEFSNFSAYVQSIDEKLKESGICKVGLRLVPLGSRLITSLAARLSGGSALLCL